MACLNHLRPQTHPLKARCCPLLQRDRQDITIRELELTPEERRQSVEIEHGHISGTVQAQLNGHPIEGHLSGMLTNGQISGAAGHVEGHDEVINVGGV